MSKFMVGQRVILTGLGGIKEIGIVEPFEQNYIAHKNDVRVFSPTQGYASTYADTNVKPLPNGQL